MEAGGKDVRARGWTRELLSAIFWARQSSCLMNLQPLWSPAQDLRKIRPVNSPHGSGRSYEGQSFFGVCMEYLQSAVVQQMAAPIHVCTCSLNWAQWVLYI